MAKAIYPLKQIIEVKERRVEDAEKALKEKRELLAQEEKKLVEKEKERDQVLKHYNDKLAQMRAEMDQGTTSPTIQQMKVYLKVVKDRLKIEEKKVQEQKELVKKAEKTVEEAIVNLKVKRQEVDKLMTHKKDWEAEVKREEDIMEGREQDELGSIIFSTQKRKY